MIILGLKWTEKSIVEYCPILETKNSASTSLISLWLYQASYSSLDFSSLHFESWMWIKPKE